MIGEKIKRRIKKKEKGTKIKKLNPTYYFYLLLQTFFIFFEIFIRQLNIRQLFSVTIFFFKFFQTKHNLCSDD